MKLAVGRYTAMRSDAEAGEVVRVDALEDLETAVYLLCEYIYGLHEVSCPCEVCEFVDRVTVAATPSTHAEDEA